MQESEKILEPKLSKKVREAGGWAIKLLPTFVKGIPDRMVLMPGGKVYFIEMKSGGETPSKIQLIIHTKLRKLGFEVYVIDSTEGINDFIRRATS